MAGDIAATGNMWLISEAADFWLACAGGGALLVAMALALLLLGDRELSAADLLLSELHLGATYDAVWRRRLWRRMPFDVLVVPLAILAATYALAMSDRPLVLTTVILYLGRLASRPSEPRDRALLPVARGRAAVRLAPLALLGRHLPADGGRPSPTSPAPRRATRASRSTVWSSTAPVLVALGCLALGSVLAYLAWTSVDALAGRPIAPARAIVHPGERWLVLANALAFGSAYVLGAWSVSFILVLVVHHEVQYLYFTYAMARRSDERAARPPSANCALLASFAVWPAIGLASWASASVWSPTGCRPFLMSGLLCHYWLDGRIWTARARRLAAA